jgi:Histidine kinase-, DNA gyrase B-, and HSP90-like ATPase
MPDSPSPREFNLQPDPRILPMLGEINLPQWRCLAELIDNAIDGFLAARRAEREIKHPEVQVNLPTSDSPSAKVTVRDSGPGMDADTLEKAVRAGWTNNDAVSSLGMFGMGFNIATARLGTLTKVWTTRENDTEWYGVEIDFERLVGQRSFMCPMLTRPKAEPHEHGTEVTIEHLKPEQRQWLSRTANQRRVAKELQRTYSAMLRPEDVPTSFKLGLNTTTLRGRQHCVWGDGASPERTVQTRLGLVNAYQLVDNRLGPRPYCVRCWQWLPAESSDCPTCARRDAVIPRERRVRGWVAIQRYLNAQEFGIDFIRHGRKIEIGNKDLFIWSDDSGIEAEYPIDDPRNRGRIVGEIHLDHCRVTYMKDRFDRNDPAWEEMVRIVRGEGPLRPDKARDLGFGENTSPLYRLYQAFRRSSPKPKVAGAYAKLLVAPDNERSEEMAQHFYAGETDYQSDQKWYELVEEADRDLLAPPTSPSPRGGPHGPDIDDFGPPPAGPVATQPQPLPAAPPRMPIASLTQEYRDTLTEIRWNVSAFEATSGDSAFDGRDVPWRLKALTTGGVEFLVRTDHEVFSSATLTPVDALLAELAFQALDRQRGNPNAPPFASVFAGLRAQYGAKNSLDAIVLSADAADALASVATSLRGSITAEDSRSLFDELTPTEQGAVHQRMASRAVKQPQSVIDEGRFLEYAPRRTLLNIIEHHPELFFDGHYWSEEYEALNYNTPAITDEARRRTLEHFLGLLEDAAWLEELDPADAPLYGRERLLRAALALELLAKATASRS